MSLNKKPEEDLRSENEGVIAKSISSEMRESYLDYAMSVITARALPDARDGLKPVHRRIFYTMHQMGLNFGARFRKAAAVVGDCMGRYHPHGDLSIYDSLIQMGQSFKTRYPLIAIQGNAGSIDGDPPAAMRYVETKMSKISSELLRDLEKNTVEWRPNYDATRREPVVLPSAIPNLLLNGTLGIAVGMATNIPPHNLSEVVGALTLLIDKPDASTEELAKFIKGPDFPTGAVLFGEKDLMRAYATGKGGVVVRGEAEITEDEDGAKIIVRSIPYRVNKSDLIESIAALARDKKLEGVKELRDESAKDIRIVIGLKSSAHPQKVLNFLYKHTQLEDAFHFNMVALDEGVPRTLTLKGLLQKFISHRVEVVTRRSQFDLDKSLEREHILIGLKKALDRIDEIITAIRKADDAASAHAALIKKFNFSDKQASAILEMRLSKLAALERKKVEEELKNTQAAIDELKGLLSSPRKIRGVIKDELKEISQKYGDERRTKIIKREAKTISPEDFIPDEENVLVLTAGGYIKRASADEYRKQRRGGKGLADLAAKEEDFVITLLTASSHSSLLFFTDRGKAYQTKMYEVPEGKRATKGKSIMNFLPLAINEKVTSVLEMPKKARQEGLSLIMVTRGGVVKKAAAKSFRDVRRNGLIAITLGEKDQLTQAMFVERGDDIILITSKGQAVRFHESDVRKTGRTASGVRGIRLAKNDFVVGADRLARNENKTEFFVISVGGFGKKTPAAEYRTQKRGGSGIKTFKVSQKTGELIAARSVVSNEDAEMVAVSKRGQTIRTSLREIPSLGRATQGVRIMKLKEGDKIASIACL